MIVARFWKTPWSCLLLSLPASSAREIAAQACLGEPAHHLIVLGSVRLDQEEKGLLLASRVRVGALFVNAGVGAVRPRSGNSSDFIYEVGAALGITPIKSNTLLVCALTGAERTAGDGATRTSVSAGVAMGSVSGGTIAGTPRMFPFIAFGIARARTRFDFVPTSGDDYSRYSYSDVFTSTTGGVGLYPIRHVVTRAAIMAPIGATARHIRFTFDVGFAW
jgi:hypothetical protein